MEEMLQYMAARVWRARIRFGQGFMVVLFR
jgi:hypothetical protein